MNARLFEFAKTLGLMLMQQGFKAYVVGGYLRDLHLEREASDIDLATNATPSQVESIFSRFLVYDAGKNFGTLGVWSHEYQLAAEITTFRKDLQCDGRRAIVEFSDTIDEDLGRRDFTINAMAMDLGTHMIFDPFNGRYDIKYKTIRTVGDADERFQEDYLRMMRACRFMALDPHMEIATATLDAIRRNARKIQRISAERLRMELLKGMGYSVPSNMIHSMRTAGLLKFILPELHDAIGVDQNRHHCLYICKECGKLHTIATDSFEEDNVKLVPWETGPMNLPDDSRSALLLIQSIVKYKDVWERLAKE